MHSNTPLTCNKISLYVYSTITQPTYQPLLALAHALVCTCACMSSQVTRATFFQRRQRYGSNYIRGIYYRGASIRKEHLLERGIYQRGASIGDMGIYWRHGHLLERGIYQRPGHLLERGIYQRSGHLLERGIYQRPGHLLERGIYSYIRKFMLHKQHFQTVCTKRFLRLISTVAFFIHTYTYVNRLNVT